MATPAENLEAAVNALTSINTNIGAISTSIGGLGTAMATLQTSVDLMSQGVAAVGILLSSDIKDSTRQIVAGLSKINPSGGIQITAAGVTINIDDKNIVAGIQQSNIHLLSISGSSRRVQYATTFLARSAGATYAELQKMNANGLASFQMQSIHAKLLQQINANQTKFGGGQNPNANTGGRKGPYANIQAIGEQLMRTGSIIANQFTKPLIKAASDFYKNSPALAGMRLVVDQAKQSFMRLGIDLTKIPQGLAIFGGALRETAFIVNNAFSQMISFIKPLVAAFDPATLQQFNLVVSNLMAVFGKMFRPILMAASTVLGSFADAMMSVADFLEPVINEFADALIDIAVPYVTELALIIAEAGSSFGTMIPFLKDLAGFILPVISTMFRGLISLINILIGSFYFVIVGLQAFVLAFQKATAFVVGIFSKKKGKEWDESAEATRKSMLEYGKKGENAFKEAFKIGDGSVAAQLKPIKQGGSTGMAAKAASFTGISDLGKGMMQAAFSSAAQDAALRTAENTERGARASERAAEILGLRFERGARMAGVRR